MSYFLSPVNLHTGENITITGEEARHISLSRRSKIGDTITLQGPNNKRFEAVIMVFKKESVMCQVRQEVAVPAEPGLHITVIQALTAEQALDTILQKSTELGVNQIMLFKATRSPMQFAVAQKKLSRWNKIMQEAAKQSNRAIFPTLALYESIADVIQHLEKNIDAVLLLEPNGNNIPQTKTTPKHIGLVVGPEGGLLAEEQHQVLTIPRALGITLGPRILRAETASIAAISILQHEYGDM